MITINIHVDHYWSDWKCKRKPLYLVILYRNYMLLT